ncbi:hypothetical protein [Haloarcula montana]|uniref:hypothetical protein n=1 Tax=Haloarcula montana TaxID=3111776 RepID=UPI002D798C71|nr:hypothetical protein [Haloarcula sp. GH36]
MSGPETDRDGDPSEAADWATRIDEDADIPQPDDEPLDAGRDRPDENIEQFDPVTEPPPEPQQTVVGDLKAYFEAYDGDFAPAPSEAFLESEFFDFTYREGVEEIDRYWVDEPFAYVAILDDGGDIQYHVVEPSLSEFERYVREDIMVDLRDILMHVRPGETDRTQRLTTELDTLLSRYARGADPGSLHKIRYYIERDLLGYDRISPLLADRNPEDISCDGTDIDTRGGGVQLIAEETVDIAGQTVSVRGGDIEISAGDGGSGRLVATGATIDTNRGMTLRSNGDLSLDGATVRSGSSESIVATLGTDGATLFVDGATISDRDDTIEYVPGDVTVDGTPTQGSVRAA